MKNPPSDLLSTVPVDRWLRRLMLNHLAGQARFPRWMGLPYADYRQLMRRVLLAPAPRPTALDQQDRLLQLLQDSRRRERLNLAQWLGQYMATGAAPIDRLLAAASMGVNHLWQDLGLASRGELRQLMTDCFPELV